MSGIIGSAGSKSGIIGTTELFYEEGTWTPNPGTGTFGSVSQNRYTRIGGYCFLTSQFTNVQGGFAYFNGLPFTTRPSGTSYDTVLLSGIMTNGIDFPSATGDLSFYLYDDNVYIYAARDDYGWSNVGESNMADNEDIIVAFAYECQ